jgi:glycosyltransferase involved in cell wall biosynthesis
MPRTSKVIYYSPAGRVQNSERELINYPPEGYKFQVAKVNPLAKSNFVFDKIRLRFLDRLMPLNLVKSGMENNIPNDVDLIYSYNHVIHSHINWVVNVEWSHILVGRDTRYFNKYKSNIEEALSSNWCKGILTWTQKAKDSIALCYDTRYFRDKIKVIPPTAHPKDYNRSYYKGGKLKILFIGSIDTPEDFYAKGGVEVIQSFKILKENGYDVELTIRANAPKELELSGIRVIRNILPKNEFEELFKQADVFVLPSHYAQEMVVLEAMSWGLPVIASEIATFGEYITECHDGLVLKTLPKLEYIQNNYLISETTDRFKLLEQIKSCNKDGVVNEIVLVIENFIKNPEYVEQLGRSAKKSSDNKFKIRNQMFKEVFDRC